MSEDRKIHHLEAETLVIGYAMSRLDTRYLSMRRVQTWKKAFAEAADALSSLASTIRNMRDEFDPIHDNPRRGWHQRDLHPSRQRVFDCLHEVSDDALMALVERILAKDHESIAEAVDAMVTVPRAVQNVAQRLLTGRQAEDFFLAHSESLVQVAPPNLIDCRLSASGYDFGVAGRPEIAIEVKGIRQLAGDVLFTDREWSEARIRLAHYWLVVIADLDGLPRGEVVIDPSHHLKATCAYQTTVTAVWRSKVSIAR